MYIHRDIEEIVQVAVRQFPTVIVTGPRQSGKTTLLKQLFAKDYRYVSMDNPDLRLMATQESKLFFDNFPPPLIIDEIQYATQLFPYIKILVDEHRDKKGLFLLTGSQLFPLMANVGESLAGRIAVFTLLSLSFREQLSRSEELDIHQLRKQILSGGFPQLVVEKDTHLELWFAGYLQTYLERDIRQLRQVGDLNNFQRFLQLLAALNGQVLNLSNLSRDLGIAVNTVKAWISILEASGQILLVQPFYLNRGKRIIKSPKVYFLDTGLVCYLTGITSIEQIFKGPLSGQIFETVVVGEVVRGFYNRGKIPRIFWWRTAHGEEVDFVIEDQGKITPLEVKLSSNINKNMAKGLLSFYELFSEKIDKAYLINLSGEQFNLGKHIVSVSFADWLKLGNRDAMFRK